MENLKILLLCSFSFIVVSIFGQQKENKIIHEFDIGITSQYHLDDKKFSFYNFLDEPYVLGGRKRGSFIIQIVPRFCFNYHRIVDGHKFSFGYLYFFSTNYNIDHIRGVDYTAVNLGYSYLNLLKSNIFSLRPKFLLQLNNGYDLKANDFGIFYSRSHRKYLEPSAGLGINLTTYIFKKIYISKELNYIFHHNKTSSFFQVNLNLGLRIN